MTDFDALHRDIREFVAERDWGRFHDPKSLLLALMGEVGEVSELLQWVRADSAATRAGEEPLASRVRDELADVFIYLICLADSVDVDLVEAANAKVATNRSRFPIGGLDPG